MPMYSYDQVLTDVTQVYEQLTGRPAPKVDLKNLRFPLPKGTDPVALVQNEIDYLNLWLLNSGMSLQLSRVPTWTPPAEIYETPQEYVVNLELAGVPSEDVNVDSINNVLIVRGKRRFRRATEEAFYRTSERAYGAFERLFALPAYVQPENMQVNHANGVLQIKLAKKDAVPGTAQGKKAGAQSKQEK